jgi:pyruvate dehydrogenase E2 component (dihydrolipoamide acetyltransferase)
MAEKITMPKLGFDMREGTLIRWVKNEGETVNKGDVLAEIETDKATVEVESQASGIVRKLFASQGDVIPVGVVMAVIGTADETIEDVVQETGKQETSIQGASTQETGKPETSKQVSSIQADSPLVAVATAVAAVPAGPVRASPLARKIAGDAKVDLSHIQGTGPGGRIVRKDVEAVLRSPQSPVASPLVPSAFRPADQQTSRLEDQVIQTTKLRQAIGRRLVESKQNLPHFYVTHEYKMDALLALRKQVNEYLPEGDKISVNDFVVKAVALALREFPNLNASLDGDKIIRHGAVNVGVAVTVEGGLLTVVSKDADQKPLRLISAEIKAMAARAREGKVKPDDVDGSTFSTSNLGMYDVENFSAIINPPEAAILAISSAREVSVVEDGQVKVGSRMKATISADHRVSDGAEAAKFMQALAVYLEEPLRLLV